jgi:hypothetical protein
MADYTVTAANVLASDKGQIREGKSGVAILAGQGLYKDPSDGSLKLADSNSGTAAARTLEGIALTSAPGVGQPVKYVSADPAFKPGFTIAPGDIVLLSDTPGGLRPAGDAVTGDFVTTAGLGLANNFMNLIFAASDAAKP